MTVARQSVDVGDNQSASLHIFCLQVDLATSSIRPARSPAWQQSLGATLLAAVQESTADITVFTGTWQHDIDQVGQPFAIVASRFVFRLISSSPEYG